MLVSLAQLRTAFVACFFFWREPYLSNRKKKERKLRIRSLGFVYMDLVEMYIIWP
jgi:hypothetical protein